MKIFAILFMSVFCLMACGGDTTDNPSSEADRLAGMEKPKYQKATDAQKVNHYLKLANNGDANGQFEIGNYYRKGDKGFAQDYAKAMKWYKKAADQNHPIAIFNIGCMHGEGHGVPKDHQEAMKWIRKAAKLGHPKANEIVEGIDG